MSARIVNRQLQPAPVAVASKDICALGRIVGPADVVALARVLTSGAVRASARRMIAPLLRVPEIGLGGCVRLV